MNMNNRPYMSEASKVYDENLYNTIPARCGNTNVLVTHGQHRKLFDTTSTSVAGQSVCQPQEQMNYMYNQQNPQQPYHINGQRQMVPNGLTYTFNPPVLENGYPCVPQYNNGVNPWNTTYCGGQLIGNNNNQNMNYPQPYTLQQQIALNQLQKNALESMLLHDQFLENPFKLQFHKNERTDTDDLAFRCQTCMSKKTLLNCMESEASNAKPNQPKPEQIYPESSKRKQLRINNFQDKGIQNTPIQESIEIQNDLIVDCACQQSRSKTTDNGTETKKVTFNECNKKSTTKVSKRRRKRTRNRSRQVDEDSSEESSTTSQSSDENN